MTEIDLSDINIDLTYQDGLRLSELYGQLGKFQYDLEHLDYILMHEHIVMSLFVIVLAVLGGIMVLGALVWWLDQSEHGDAKLILGMVLYVAVVAIIFYFVWDYTTICTEMKLERNIQSTQMQIDAILMKYGWEGI